MKLGKTFGLAGLLAMSLGSTAGAAVDDGFYKGKTVYFIIASAAGGGFDHQSRLIARHIGDALAGTPSVVAQNMPGSGSIRAADHLYFTAPKDGTVIGMIDPGVYNSQLMGEPQIRFDMAKFTWIGRMVNNSPVVYTWHESPIRSWQDLFTKEAFIAASGATPRLNYIALNTVLNSKIKAITGYSGAGISSIAMERGEVHGLSQPWSILKQTRADWIKQKKIIPILQTGAESHPELPHVPRMIDLAKTDEDRRLFEFIALPSLIGRSVIAPPGIPKDRTAELRAAFEKMLVSPKFVAEIEKGESDLAPMTGEELEKFMTEGVSYPPSVIERAKAIAAIYAKEAENTK